MREKLLEGLVETAMVLGINNAEKHIGVVNDAMDEIRSLEEKVKNRDKTIEELESKLVRQQVRRYHTV